MPDAATRSHAPGDDGTREAYGPAGDPAAHRPRATLEAGLLALPAAPRDLGVVTLIVARCADGVRETPDRVLIAPDAGIPGDRWGRRTPRRPEAQLTVMTTTVAGLIANGQPLTVFGDNLFVDLDLSAANLPVGSRLRVGQAVVVVSPKPHNGCHKFRARFGEDALAFVAAAPTRHRNLRGVYWTVVEAGEVWVGGEVQVLGRAPKTDPGAATERGDADKQR